MNINCVFWHAFASEMVTVYDPAHNPVTEEVVAPPGLHKYVYAPVPPPALTEDVPLHPAEQLAFVEETVADKTAGCVMETLFVEAQP